MIWRPAISPLCPDTTLIPYTRRAASFKRLLGGGYRGAPGSGGGSPCCAIFSMKTRKRHSAASDRKLTHTAPPTAHTTASRASSRGVTGACSMGANTSLPLEDNRPPAYCLTRRSVSLQEDGWGADPRRVKRGTARPHPIAFGSVVAGSTRDSWSEISVAEIVAGGATIGSGVSPKRESPRAKTVSCTSPALLASYIVSRAVESMSVKCSENDSVTVYVRVPSVARTTVPRATTVA